MNKLPIILYLLLMIAVNTTAQHERKYIRKGTEEYNKAEFGNSEVSYLKAIEEDNESFEAHFNLGGAFYKQGKYNKAIEEFSNLVQSTTNKDRLTKLYHNLGNCNLKLLKHPIDTLNANEIYAQINNPNPQFSQELIMSVFNPDVKKQFEKLIAQTKPAFDSYKNALKLNPKDIATKYNLSYTNKLKRTIKKLLEAAENKGNNNQNQQNQQQNQDNQQNQNQNNQDQQNNNQNQNQDNQQNQQNQNQNNQNSNPNDQDGDGIPDKTEKGDNPSKPRDTDKDGTPDYKDSDSDNDGKPDSQEAGQNPENPQDTDKDGLPDYRDLDSDNDGKPDSEERQVRPTNQISREDALRMLEAIENNEKDVQEKLKRVKGTRVKKEKDW